MGGSWCLTAWRNLIINNARNEKKMRNNQERIQKIKLS